MVGEKKSGQGRILYATVAVTLCVLLGGCFTAEEAHEFFTDPAWQNLRPGIGVWPGADRKWYGSSAGSYTSADGTTFHQIPPTQDNEEETTTDLGGA